MAKLKPDPTLYPTPRDAMKAPPEDVAYVAALYVGTGIEAPDFLAVVDVDPKSPTYGRIVHKSELPYMGDELHHFGRKPVPRRTVPTQGRFWREGIS